VGTGIFRIGIQIPLFLLQTAGKGKWFANVGTFLPTSREKSFSNGKKVNGKW
jgi:hypothetical protein